jgi:hypothetical protein
MSFVAAKRWKSEFARANVRADSIWNRHIRKCDGMCVNHGERPRTHGCRCFECWLVHRLTKKVASGLLDESVARCAGCALRVPRGYGEFVVDVGVFHKRCAGQYEKELSDGY